MSYTQSLYHIVFSTLNREAVIDPIHANRLYKVMASIIQKTKSKAYIINGMENHIHILLSLHPDMSLSSLVRDLKSKSSTWCKKSGYFPMFGGWEREYGAFSLSESHKDAVYKYIESQQIHHTSAAYDKEFERLVMKNGLMMYNPGE